MTCHLNDIQEATGWCLSYGT